MEVYGHGKRQIVAIEITVGPEWVKGGRVCAKSEFVQSNSHKKLYLEMKKSLPLPFRFFTMRGDQETPTLPE